MSAMKNAILACSVACLGVVGGGCNDGGGQQVLLDVSVGAQQLEMTKGLVIDVNGTIGTMIQGDDVAGSGAHVMIVAPTETTTGSFGCSTSQWISYRDASGVTYTSQDGATGCFYVLDAE